MSENSTTTPTVSSDNIIQILVATDNHLGYEENDPIIGNDSFIAFEEILQLAVEHSVDMILLGGDLFHHNNPTQQTFNRCMALLRKYTMGDKQIFLKLHSSLAIEKTIEGGPPVNYMDLNLNVAIPVFSIHGNHDDPSGVGLCSSMDTLSSAGLINYFGKKTSLDNIEIAPILLQKGHTRLALYGLSHIKDERLSRLYLQDKVTMLRPKEFTAEWFNLFVLHQNRVDRGPKRFVSDSYLPDFLDLIVWGHEHDCDIVPEQNMDKGFFITQPGSSVPTSLSEGETKPKHVGLLKINKKKFKLEPIRLRTTRPFVFESIRLKDVPVTSAVRQKKTEEIRAYCERKVESMIMEAKELLSGHPNQPTLPLVRLRCEFADETEIFNVVKFGQQFYKRVANPDTEIIRFKKIPAARDKAAVKDAIDDLNRLREMNDEEPETFASCVESIVEKYFETFAEKKMLVLSVKGMAAAVQNVVDKGDNSAIDAVCKYQRDVTLKKMMEMEDVNESNVTEHLTRLRDEREANKREANLQNQQLHEMFESRRGSYYPEETDDPPDVSLLSDEEPEVPVKPARGRGRAAAVAVAVSDDEIGDEEEAAPVRGRGRGRGRGRARGATSSRARGTRAPRAPARAKAAPASISNFFTPTPRATPTRAAAQSSQARMAAISYDDDYSD